MIRRVSAVMAKSKRDGIAVRMHVHAYPGAAYPGWRTIEVPDQRAKSAR